MPRRAALKVVNRPGTPTIYVRGTVAGIRVYESTGTTRPALAEEYRADLEKRLYQEKLHGPAPAKLEDRTFAAAVISYLEADTRSTNTRSYLSKLLEHFRDARLSQVDQAAVDAASKDILRPNSSGATRLRQIVTPIRAILRHAASRGMIATVPVLQTPKVEKVRRTFLRPAEVVALIRAAAPAIRPMLAFAVATGARPAEYLDLEWTDVDLRGRRATLRLKGGGTRECDLPQIAVIALQSIHQRSGAVFQPPGKARYRDTERSSGGQFSVAWAGACHRAGLPGKMRIYARKDRARGPSYERFAPEHTPYVLRHTWASWHYAIHKDIIKLERDGAWEGPDMVRVYAHLMPDIYRQEAMDLLEGRVDLGFGEPGADKRFRAVAVQLGRTAPLGRQKRA